MLVCQAQPEVHILLEHKQLQTSYRNLPISNYRKIPHCQSRFFCHLSHTHVLLYEMTLLTAADVYLILANAVLLSVSVLLSINPQRSHTEEVVGDYCGQWMFGDNLKQGAHKERYESQQ